MKTGPSVAAFPTTATFEYSGNARLSLTIDAAPRKVAPAQAGALDQMGTARPRLRGADLE